MESPKIYLGEHCETTATGVLLQEEGVNLSEPMMLGLSQGFGFIYWKMNFMNLPFIGGRSKPFELTRQLCENMNLSLDVRETTSKKKAWKNVTEFLDMGIPVGLQVDCYHLEHFQHAFHFAGHFITAFKYYDHWVYIYDTGKKYKVSLENLEKARFEKGSMAAKALSYTILNNQPLTPIELIIPKALEAVAKEFLNPPLKCFGYKGIIKLGQEMLRWLDSVPDPKGDLFDQYDMMENAGTGGAIFRNFYRDYLKECTNYLPQSDGLKRAAVLYEESAQHWTDVAELIKIAGEEENQDYLSRASQKCYLISDLEKKAMESLLSP